MTPRRRSIALLATLLVGYGSFYLCRANLEAAGPLLIAHEGFDKTRFGELSTIAVFTYAIGKFLMGGMGDVLGGRRMYGVAVAGSVVFSLCFGVSSSFVLLAVFAAANRFFQSGGWSAIVHVVSRRFEPGRHGTVMGILSTSYELGNVAALNLSGLVVHTFASWRALFVVNPLLFAVIGGGVFLVLRAGDAPVDADAPRPPPEPRLPLSEILPVLARRGSFWLAVVLSMLLTFVRTAFLTWTPTYLYEVGKVAGHAADSDATIAIVKSSIFPAAGVIAAATVGPLTDRLGPGRRAPVMAASLTVVVVLVLVLGHAGIHDSTTAALLIGGVGLFVLGPYSLMAGVIALDVAGKRGTATATGIIDGAGYLAGTAAGYVLGRLADGYGWSAVFDLITAAVVLATLVSGGWAVAVLRGLRRTEKG
jgi:OPA family glycerol-3-phosphate transporter-like MFS transporter